jgi:RNase adapter protein RapZ
MANTSDTHRLQPDSASGFTDVASGFSSGLVIVSGLSGSGKTTALQLLEDSGYTCIDNLPVSLLPALISQTKAEAPAAFKLAVGVDARNIGGDLQRFPSILQACALSRSDYTVIYLDAQADVLLKRFSETRRKHPLSSGSRSLQEAIVLEKTILQPLAAVADLSFDTSAMTLHELRSVLRKKVIGSQSGQAALSFESFGFKYGVPADADFVFDVRCLPNPFWQPTLRNHTGEEDLVAEFLRAQPEVMAMVQDIQDYLSKWLPAFEANNRSYLTVAIGCTGGMHRSVFVANALATFFKSRYPTVHVRHRQLSGQAEPIARP